MCVYQDRGINEADNKEETTRKKEIFKENSIKINIVLKV